MSIQTIESAFSRIPNGNFSHGIAGWASASAISVNKSATTPNSGAPYYVLSVSNNFWVDVPYRDLAVFPSVMDFEGGSVQPSGINDVFIYSPFRYPNYDAIQPFRAKLAAGYGPEMERGAPVYVTDTTTGEYTGEYRARDVLQDYSSNYVLRADSAKPLEPIIGSDSFPIAYYAKDSTFIIPNFQFKVMGAPLSPPVQLGDYFVMSYPAASGRVSAILAPGIIQVTAVYPHRMPPDTGPGTVWVSTQSEWKFLKAFNCNIRRVLPVCLYDLSLAFSLENTSSVSLNGITIDFLDEFGAVVDQIFPAPLTPSSPWSPVNYIFKAIPGTSYTRYVFRFMGERTAPNYGTARVSFPCAGASKIGDVVLFRGNFTEQLTVPETSTKTFDFLEQSIAVESGIIPKGTIIGFVGGSVCPPGYVRAEGIGRMDEDEFDNYGALNSEIGPAATVLAAQDWGLRDINGGAGAPPSREPRTYFRYTTNGLKPREDVSPGFIMEFRFSAYSVFAVISAASRHYVENRVNSADELPSGTQRFEFELVGDFVEVLEDAEAATSCDIYVWRNGTLAFVQDAAELGDFEDAGGFGYLAWPHRHEVALSEDMEYFFDIDWHGHPSAVQKPTYWKHEHLDTWKSASVPMVRPILLCQKV